MSIGQPRHKHSLTDVLPVSVTILSFGLTVCDLRIPVLHPMMSAEFRIHLRMRRPVLRVFRGLLVCAIAVVAVNSCISDSSFSAPEEGRFIGGIEVGTGDNQDPGGCSPTVREAGSIEQSEGFASFNSTCSHSATVDCGASFVQWEGLVSCVFSPNGTPGVAVQAWHFTPAETPMQPLVSRQSTSALWSGQMVRSGTISVEFTVNQNQTFSVSDVVTVGARTGSMSWASSVGGRRGNPGEIDSCFLPFQLPGFELGLTTGQSCTASNNQALFTPASALIPGQPIMALRRAITSGPNTGLTYVAVAYVTMQLRSQVHRELRADGFVYPVSAGSAQALACGSTNSQSNYSMNVQCYPNSKPFLAYTGATWTHEDSHIAAALDAARTSGGDLHQMFMDIQPSLPHVVLNAADDDYNRAQGVIRAASLAVHTAGTDSVQMWMYDAPTWKQMWLRKPYL